MENAADRYRLQAVSDRSPSPWAEWARQDTTLHKILENVIAVARTGRRALVVLDLDLTTLLAPDAAQAALVRCVQALDQLPTLFNEVEQGKISRVLQFVHEQWISQNSRSTLLPSYTDGGLEGYGVYFSAILQQRCELILGEYQRGQLEQWITQTVYAQLRSGYWERDIADDEIAAGLPQFLQSLHAAGGEAVFFSNRPASTRTPTINKLQSLLRGAGTTSGSPTLFAYIGPGGSQFDAAAKAAAVKHVERGASSGVYLGAADSGTVLYQPTGTPVERESCIVAVFDDRSTNREQIMAAADRSKTILQQLGQPLLPVAMATSGHTPEIAVTLSEFAIADFRFKSPD